MNVPHPSPEAVSSCPVCSKYAGEHAVIFHHLAVCCRDLPFDLAYPAVDLPECGRSSVDDLYHSMIHSITDELNKFDKDDGANHQHTPGCINVTQCHAEFLLQSGRVVEAEKDIQRAFGVAKKKSKKDFVDLERFRLAKHMPQIQLLLSHCKYPEDDESPSGKCFIPILLLRRANLLIKKPPIDIDFKLVLDDLSLVEEYLEFLPKPQQHSLYYVKTFCQLRLKLYADAKISLEKSSASLKFSNLEEDARKLRLEKLKKGREMIAKNGTTNMSKPGKMLVEPEMSSINPKYPALSGKVDVVFRLTQQASISENLNDTNGALLKTQGRGIVAKEDIKAGEIIAIEDPIVATLRHDLIHVTHSHCHHCLIPTYHLLPCPNCCLVMFCSICCRDASVGSYHKFECKIGLSLLSVALGGSFQYQVGLALRLLFMHSPGHWVKKEREYRILKKPEYDMGKYLGSAGVYSSGDLKHFWNLENHVTSKEEAALPRGTLMKYMEIISSHAMRLVKDSGYLDNKTFLPCKSKQVETVIFKVMSHALRVARFNSLVMGEPTTKALLSPTDSATNFNIFGQGVYNTLSLFNHSCARNAARFNCGNKSVVVAARKIEKGQEVFLSYYFGALEVERNRRFALLLDEFGFMCECLACTKNWSYISPDEGAKKASWNFDISETSWFINNLRTKNFDAIMQARVAYYERTSLEMRESSEIKMVAWCEVGSHCFLQLLHLKHCIKLMW